MEIVSYMVKSRREISLHGGVLITDDILGDIAERCGLSISIAAKAFERWQVDSDDGIKVFEITRQDRYLLADNADYGDARRFVDKTAKISMDTSNRTRRRTRKKV